MATQPITLAEPVEDTPRQARRGYAGALPVLGLLPFLAYIVVFMVIPTINVAVGAFRDNDGAFTSDNVSGLFDATMLHTLWNSVVVSGVSAVLGGVLGVVLASIIVAAPATSLLRRMVMAIASVFAQFGGVNLAFAFIATVGAQGVLTVWLRGHGGFDLYGNGWLYGVWGLVLVYLYFQIPLMVVVFIPALEGLKPQWREAAVSLGASRRQYLTGVAVPLLRPAFLGSVLLLFANAFAAYATAAALVSQGQIILPLMIRAGLTSEVLLGRQHLAYAIALEMIVVVAIVMTAYALLLRRAARWLR
ncbi:ABC transporter permease subunit [Nocardioides sp. CER19]|uniref:ABC transporter permease n=1 Tax=Nocardioides sp. CER19 TaxID=3038538 RepID=UPI002446B2C8|nr:ABC transporter permease subunit [Nocardioides sp. CER19]MDH2414938.1 ABC transporter permease subunit [Nocardioides sp. CER19]